MTDPQSIDTSLGVCLIDGDSLLYYSMGAETLEKGTEDLDSRIQTILNHCKCSVFIGFLTGRDGYRYSVSPSYKANRKHRPKPIIFYALREYLKQVYSFKEFPGLEADDLVSYYSQNSEGIKTTICSPDKDVLYQCVGRHFNYQKLEFIETSEWDSEKFLWKQILMGDSTDNIPGIPGVGIKTAENWLKDRENDIGGFAFKKYVEKFGVVEGLIQFYINFKLVYLLKSKQDINRETGYELPLINDLLCITPKLEENAGESRPDWENW
jgi:5'-3' exonuclease